MVGNSFFCVHVWALVFLSAWNSTNCSRVVADDGPYCGIYAVYGAAAAVGVQCEFQTLVDPRFVSSGAGSTIGDLVSAAEHLGVRATPLTGLGLANLQESQDPLVLHVSSLGQLDAYNHWLLFLGIENGRARVTDGSGAIHPIGLAELLARWDGVALAVFKVDSPKTNFGAVETATIGWWAILVLGAIGSASWMVGKLTSSARSRARAWAVALVAGTFIVTIVREAQPAFSFLRNRECVAFIVAAEGGREFPTVSVVEMVELSKSPESAVIFDTRYNGDMAYGHIPGAIRLPIDSNQHEVAVLMQAIDHKRPIVLYCQGAGCRFSDRMAVVLTSFGYEDIRIFRDGWIGWEEFHNKSRARK